MRVSTSMRSIAVVAIVLALAGCASPKQRAEPAALEARAELPPHVIEVAQGLYSCERGYLIREGRCIPFEELDHGPVVEVSSLPSAGDGAPGTVSERRVRLVVLVGAGLLDVSLLGGGPVRLLRHGLAVALQRPDLRAARATLPWERVRILGLIRLVRARAGDSRRLKSWALGPGFNRPGCDAVRLVEGSEATARGGGDRG